MRTTQQLNFVVDNLVTQGDKQVVCSYVTGQIDEAESPGLSCAGRVPIIPGHGHTFLSPHII